MGGASQSDDFYVLLGVPPTASEDEIYAAYRDRCFLLHPDRLAGAPPGARQRAEQDIRRLNRAWEVLGDPVSRAAHDAWYLTRNSEVGAPSPVVEEPPSRSSATGRRPRIALGLVAAAAFVLGAGSTALAMRAHERAAPVITAATAAPLSPTTTPVPVPLPIVADGGFEQDSGGWTLEGGMRRVPGEGRSASAGLRVPGEGGWDNVHRTIVLPAPGCYQIAAWVRGEGSARLDLLTTDWGPVAVVRLGHTSVWTLQSSTHVTERTGLLLLAIRDSEPGAHLMIDDVSITPCMHE